MRFSCQRTQLADIVSLLADVLPSRSAKPVLQNIEIIGRSDGTITLSATDLEVALSCSLAVDDLTDPSTVLLPGARLAGLLRDDWSPQITLSVDGQRAEIASDNGVFHLMGDNSEDFPPIPEMPDKNNAQLDATSLSDAVKKTLFATARGDTRYALNGIYLTFDKKNIHFVASDTHRLSLVRKKSAKSLESAEAIVISKGLLTLARVAEGEEEITLHLGQHQLIAATPSAVLSARLVDGQFPRYRDVIPKDLANKITVNRELLMKTLRLAGQLTDEETRSITLSASGDMLLLTAAGAESGDARLEIPATIEGGDVQVSFNYLYIMDLLKVLEEDEVTLQFQNAESPARIDVGDFTHVIMPIRPRG